MSLKAYLQVPPGAAWDERPIATRLDVLAALTYDISYVMSHGITEVLYA